MSGNSMEFMFGKDVEKTSSGLKKTSRQPQKPAQVRSAQDQTTSGSMLMSSLLHKSAQAPRKRDPNSTYRSQGCVEERAPATTLSKEKEAAEEKERAYLARNKSVEKPITKTGSANNSATDAAVTYALHTDKVNSSEASHTYHGSEALKAFSSLNINMATAILTVTRNIDFSITITVSGFSKKRTSFGADMADRKKDIFGITGQEDFSDAIGKKQKTAIFKNFLPIGRCTEKAELSASAFGRQVPGILNFLDYKSKKNLVLEVKISHNFLVTATMNGVRLLPDDASEGKNKTRLWGFTMAKSVAEDMKKVPAGTTTSDEDDFTALEVEAAIAAAFEKEMTEIDEVKCGTTSMSPPASTIPLKKKRKASISMSPPASTTPLKKKRKASTSTSPSSELPTKKLLHEIMGSLPGAYSALNTSAANINAPDCDASVNDEANETKSKKVPKSNLNANMHVFALHDVPMPDFRELLAKARVPTWEQQAPMLPTGAQPTVNDFGDEVEAPTAEAILAKVTFDRDTKLQHEAMERQAAQLEEAERKKAAAAIKWKQGKHGIRYRLQGDHVHMVPQGRPLRDATVEPVMTQQLADAKSGGRQAIWEKDMGFVEEKREVVKVAETVVKRKAEDTPVKEPKKRLSLAEYKAKAKAKKEQGQASPAPATDKYIKCQAPAPDKDTESQAPASTNEVHTDAMAGQPATKQVHAEVPTAVEASQSELAAQHEKKLEQATTLALEKESQDKADAEEAQAKASATKEQAKAEAQAADEHAKGTVAEEKAKTDADAEAEKAKANASASKEQEEISISVPTPKVLKPVHPAAAARVASARQKTFQEQVQEQEQGRKRDEERHRLRRQQEAEAAMDSKAAGNSTAPIATTSSTATASARPSHNAYAGKIPRKGPSGAPTEQPISSPEARPQHNGHATKSPSLVNIAAAATEQTKSTSAAPKPAKRKSEEADIETEPMKDSSKKAKITKTTSAKRVTAREDSPEPIAEKNEMDQVSHEETLHSAPDVDTSGATLSDDDAPLAKVPKGTKRQSEDDSMSPPAKRRQPPSSMSGQGLDKATKKGFGELKQPSGKQWDDRIKGCDGDAAQDAIDEAEFAAVLAKNAPQSKKKKAAAGTKSPAVELYEKDLQKAFVDGTLKAKLNGHSRPEIWNWVKEIGGGIGNGLSKVTKADLITGIVEGCRVRFAGLQQQCSAPRGGGHRQGGQTQRRRSSPEPVRRNSKPSPLHRTQNASIDKSTRRPNTATKAPAVNAMSQLKASYVPGSAAWVRAEEKQARRDATSAGTMFDAAAFKRATTPAIKAYEDEQAENARKWAEAEAKEKAEEKAEEEAKERAAARPRQQMPPAAGGRFWDRYRPSPPPAGPTAAQREVEATRAQNLSRRDAAIEEANRRRQRPLNYE
ncbi:unnamed protein product [Zymoseptoria tritici ST99CH_3D7]|uniref:Uncharacterized protein n=1 Tax=Zymoseptoria tritici (strain ST99CH_3D7) TaxID=1276538 RepID=A0A1X7RZI5_ZYMT9|nr:unnamed protein product [Zymoseptoria tritici ST99CH_3D7]